ncbi:HAD family hydrolase [Methanohalophilus halophilus]|uniref:HAD family hydrolase n=1 Tax=Methanohalophilus halophilus TaxID=2177 RepID=A0A1L3Q4F9_9EURY|nr:HAD family hydrolase [Methanohalophilus halophilus]APH39728.1 HAD family hydrolase [Methanohalophilus halophilus]RNI08933.1 HAD family hydrolase [Methanohalophilus halophilus]SDW37704.1 putative hydrolase of the HAD superfamily [Methanohalophilus halophilus]
MLQNGEIRGLVFDCYKTLIDIKTKEESHSTNEAVSNWLRYQGVSISAQDFRDEYVAKVMYRINHSEHEHPEIRVEEIFSEICRENAIWEIDDYWLGIETAKVFRNASVRRMRAYPESIRLLEKYRHMPKCIVSNGQRVFSEQELKYLGLFDHFDHVIFSSDYGYKKPDTRLFHEALNRLGCAPGEVVSIGDTPRNDIHAPQSIGMKAIHVHDAWKHHS